MTVIDREDRCGRRYKQGYLYQNSDKCLFLDLFCNMLAACECKGEECFIFVIQLSQFTSTCMYDLSFSIQILI